MNVLSIQEILSIFVCLIFKKSRIYGMLIDGSCNLEKNSRGDGNYFACNLQTLSV